MDVSETTGRKLMKELEDGLTSSNGRAAKVEPPKPEPKPTPAPETAAPRRHPPRRSPSPSPSRAAAGTSS